mgnify:CR=1 FL=1
MPSIEWTVDRLKALLPNKKIVVFANGSCVVWQGGGEPNISECKNILLNVVLSHPDFKVRNHPSGDFLVTFKGGVGSVVSGQLLQENFTELKSEALDQGRLTSEILESSDNAEDSDVIAGLYARARLYLDVDNSQVVSVNT